MKRMMVLLCIFAMAFASANAGAAYEGIGEDMNIRRQDDAFLVVDDWAREALYYVTDGRAEPWGEQPQEDRLYRVILALQDGGLAAVNWIPDGTWAPQPRFTRWDAEGQIACDAALELGSKSNQPEVMCETEDGFCLITLYGELVRLDRGGNVLAQKRFELPGDCLGMEALPEGGVMVTYDWNGDVYTKELEI